MATTTVITKSIGANCYTLNLKNYTEGKIIALLHALNLYVEERKSPVAREVMSNIVYGIVNAHLPATDENAAINGTIAEIKRKFHI